MGSNDGMGFFGFAIIVFFILIGVAIVAAISLVKKSKEKAKQSEQNVNRIMAKIPEDKQMVFMMQYNNSKKDPTTAVLLSLFLGGLGAHKFYLGKTGMGILYLLFSWTTIPAFLGLFEAFTISEKVAKLNEKTALELSNMF